MAKSFSCRDMGVDCDFIANGETAEEVMQKCAEHAQTEHGLTQLLPELAVKVMAAIKDA